MVFPMKCRARRVAAGICVLLLALLLAACGGSTTTTSSNTNTSNTNTNAHPVQQVLTPTATPDMTATYKQYTGSGFTIKYPQNWKVTTSNTAIAFTDPSGKYSMTINSQANSNGSLSANQLVTNQVEEVKKGLKNAETVSVPETTTVGGQSWTQQSISGSSTVNGTSSDTQTVVLGTNYPARTAETKGYSITYVAPKEEFSQTTTTYFTPMLDTFKFMS